MPRGRPKKSPTAFTPVLQEPPATSRGRGSRRAENGILARLSYAFKEFGSGKWVLVGDDFPKVNAHTAAHHAVKKGEFPKFETRSEKQPGGKFKLWVKFDDKKDTGK